MKKKRTAKDLIAIYKAVMDGETFCAHEGCDAVANVFVYSNEQGDVYMCPLHAADELDG